MAICRGKPWWYKGKTFDALAPSRAMLTMSEADFDTAYRATLAKLDLKEIYEQLGEGTVLLCWEAFNVRCHRRLVAEAFERALGVVIPEVGHDRSECLPYADQQRANKAAKSRD